MSVGTYLHELTDRFDTTVVMTAHCWCLLNSSMLKQSVRFVVRRCTNENNSRHRDTDQVSTYNWLGEATTWWWRCTDACWPCEVTTKVIHNEVKVIELLQWQRCCQFEQTPHSGEPSAVLQSLWFVMFCPMLCYAWRI